MSQTAETYPHWGEGMARSLAQAVHTGQVDKCGAPYYLHPQRVAALLGDHPRFAALPDRARSDALVAAWLHDVVEDTSLTLDMLAALGCPPRALHAIDLLTRKPGQSPAAYYAGVASDPTALLVKACDIADNTNARRLAKLEPATAARLKVKYAKAKAALGLPDGA